MFVFYWVAKYTLGVALKGDLPALVARPQRRARRGPVILVSNHLSFADHFFGPMPLPRKVVFLAKSEYFTGKGIKGLLTKAFFSGVGQIPIDRTGGDASERALRSGLRVLAEGNVLGIYPEGTRSPDGRLYKGKTGVARLALESRASVVPCAMIGTFEFLPPGSLHPSLKIRPGVIFGQPMEFPATTARSRTGRRCARSRTRSSPDRETVGTGVPSRALCGAAKELIARQMLTKETSRALPLPEKELRRRCRRSITRRGRPARLGRCEWGC